MSAFQVSEKCKTEIQESLGTNKKNILGDIAIIKTWIEQEKNLPNVEVFSDKFLERILLDCKFRIEKAKMKIENYCILRGTYPELYENYDKVAPSAQPVTWLHLPIMLPTKERIVLVKVTNPDVDKFVYLETNKYTLAVQEIAMQCDYNLGYRGILDLGGFSLGHIGKINISDYVKATKLYMGAYSGRLRGIHIINYPTHFSIVVNTLKAVLKGEEGKKIHIHDNIESVFEIIPQKYWTSEYGGDVGSIPELMQTWDNFIKSNSKYFEECAKRVSTEFRLGESKERDIFGKNGTFKYINVD